MKKKILFVLSLVAGVALMSMAADPADGKASESDNLRELRAQITELRTEVNKLRQRTQTLESTVEELKHSSNPSPPNLQSSPAVPSPLQH
jgi:septal ring factor EnvC (AmiA/AmiB activator)